MDYIENREVLYNNTRSQNLLKEALGKKNPLACKRGIGTMTIGCDFYVTPEKKLELPKVQRHES